MQLYVNPSVTMDTLEHIARDMGIAIDLRQSGNSGDNGIAQRGRYKGRRRLRFHLRPITGGPKVPGTKSKRWQKVVDNPFGGGMGARNDGRRNVHAICWHGFWEFMMRVFDYDPDATFITAIDRWDGLDDFLARAQQSGTRNVGSIMYPAYANEACDCVENGGYILRRIRIPKAAA